MNKKKLKQDLQTICGILFCRGYDLFDDDPENPDPERAINKLYHWAMDVQWGRNMSWAAEELYHSGADLMGVLLDKDGREFMTRYIYSRTQGYHGGHCNSKTRYNPALFQDAVQASEPA